MQAVLRDRSALDRMDLTAIIEARTNAAAASHAARLATKQDAHVALMQRVATSMHVSLPRPVSYPSLVASCAQCMRRKTLSIQSLHALAPLLPATPLLTPWPAGP